MASATSKVIQTGSRLPPLPTIRDLVRQYKLRAIKSLSQNFLMDERLTDKIVRAAGKIEGHYVIEVGPGPGSITRSIIRQSPQHLVVVEKDRRFMPTLEMLSDAAQRTCRMDIIRGDILNYPMDTAFAINEKYEWNGTPAPIHVIGNLPFAISTRLLINWLKDISLQRGVWSLGRSSLTLTFQQEVAERIVAPILSAQRCRLSVMSQLWTKPTLKFTIPGTAFVPKPEVDVGVVTFVPYKTPLTDLPFDIVEKVIRLLFSMRQKYCRRGISNLYPDECRDEFTDKTFQDAYIDPTLRSFELSNEECIRIAQAYYNIIQIHPEIEKYNYRGSKQTVNDSINQSESEF